MSTATIEPTNTEAIAPGVHDLPESTYLRDPVPGGSLSASGAKLILECPAKFRHRQLAGEQHRDYFDFGKAAHAEVLGAGAPLAVIDAADWRSKDARDQRDEARENGNTPILAKDHAVVKAMAEQIRLHPIASELLNPDKGKPEQTLIWHDLIWRRSRLDWLPELPESGRLIVPDYKTCADASASGFTRSAASYGYMMQAAWYLDGVRTLLGADDAAFVFIAQEKEAPYVVNVVEMTADFLAIGDWRNEVAVERYMRCMETGIWPGYSDEVQRISAPRWLEIEHEQQTEMKAEGITSW